MKITARQICKLSDEGLLNQTLRRNWTKSEKEKDPVSLRKTFLSRRVCCRNLSLLGLIIALFVSLIALWPPLHEIYESVAPTGLLLGLLKILGVVGAASGFAFEALLGLIYLLHLIAPDGSENFRAKLAELLGLFCIDKLESIADETEEQLRTRATTVMNEVAHDLLWLTDHGGLDDRYTLERVGELTNTIRDRYDLFKKFGLAHPSGYGPYYDAAREQLRLEAHSSEMAAGHVA